MLRRHDSATHCLAIFACIMIPGLMPLRILASVTLRPPSANTEPEAQQDSYEQLRIVAAGLRSQSPDMELIWLGFQIPIVEKEVGKEHGTRTDVCVYMVASTGFQEF